MMEILLCIYTVRIRESGHRLSSKSTFRHINIICDGFSAIINDSLIQQTRVQLSDSDTSFRQQNVTFQCKMTSIIRQQENVAKYFR